MIFFVRGSTVDLDLRTRRAAPEEELVRKVREAVQVAMQRELKHSMLGDVPAVNDKVRVQQPEVVDVHLGKIQTAISLFQLIPTPLGL